MRAFIGHIFRLATGWLLSIGIWRATVVTTVLSSVLSILVSFTINLIRQDLYPLSDWLLPATVAPLLISPAVSFVILKLAYQLEETKQALHKAATTDALTGAYNRRQLFESSIPPHREKEPFSILMIDIDHFKTINDTYGHAAGDAALVALAETCLARIRKSDSLFRWGGEEFLVTLPATGLDGALHVAEALREAIGATRVPQVPRRITASIGVAVFDSDKESFDEVVFEADQQLYRAKEAGRNCVMHGSKDGKGVWPKPERAQRTSRRAAG